jgi:archaeosine synthase beta-subunit
VPAGGPGMTESDGSATRWVRSLRTAKQPIDAWSPISWFWEEERQPAGAPTAALTILLAGAECSFSCVFCDLWRQTLDRPTPRGALAAQVRSALAAAGPLPADCAIKLYNASNFFAQQAVPIEDEPEIAGLLAPFARVTVECHPRLVGARCLAFAHRLGASLEVAMGLETADPALLARLNKGMSLDDFDRAAETLRLAGIGMRVFVLLGAPFVPPVAAVERAVQAAAYALDRGAARVSLLPVRPGNGALEALERRGEFFPPTLAQLEEALERCLDLGPGLVAADLWDAHRFATCGGCAGPRLARLARLNRTGTLEPRHLCASCGWG